MTTPIERAAVATVTVRQRDRVADEIWDQMVGVAKSSVREAVAGAFEAAEISVSPEEIAATRRTAQAEALREAAAAMGGEDEVEWPFIGMDEMQRWLRKRAEEIERGDW
ncbi:hypothetical protein GCG21_08770 [Pseudactinotalea sp. HY160]|uniref:hypothetical protein n=1 Tax=Pseudactinotalea sp. HY160 TaxID=2654490 RepID=UPI00128E6388|nr:hypothetical protein [Pseudactinotalea sp. HY160]MPV50097.1 hypothetical protein [Pseudactinotalea sp. HY160]